MTAFRNLLINDEPVGLERRNMAWNMAGSFLYAFASMVLSMIVVQLVGDEQGGIFTFAFSTFGQQMFMVAYFGIRPFQITDVENQYTFGDYLGLRILTSAAALAIGAGYVFCQGYAPSKGLVVLLMVCYKVIDGFADVYEAEFQRSGRLYLTGKSNAFRTLLSVSVFFGVLFVTRNLVAAGAFAAAAQLLGVLVFDVWVIGALPNVDWSRSPGGIRRLTGSVLLLFLSVFLDFYIFSAAKYAIEKHMGDADLAVYGAIFMPTSVINLVAGFVIRPFLTRLSFYWEQGRQKDFLGVVRLIFLVVLGLTVLAVFAAAVFGIPVISLLYPNLRPALASCRLALAMIILGGGFNAWMNLFYYTLVIMGKQRWIFIGYVLVCAAAAVISPAAVMRGGITGGAASYLALMILLAACFAGMTASGIRARRKAEKTGKRETGYD